MSKPHRIEYFSVSNKKLIVLALCTFGLYGLYWHYRNWKEIEDKGGESIFPLLRGLLSVLFCYGLFSRILSSARLHGFKPRHSAGILATAYILIVLALRAPGPFWFVYLLSFIPLIYVQSAIAANNSSLNPSYVANSKFSKMEIFISIAGGAIVALTILASFRPVKDDLVKEYFKNGNLKTETAYSNDILEGVSRGYYETGSLEWEQSYEKGKVEGVAKAYYGNGQIQVATNFREGKKHGGSTVYYEDGTIAQQIVYRNGKKVKIKEYDEFGNLITNDLKKIRNALAKIDSVDEFDLKDSFELVNKISEAGEIKGLSKYKQIIYNGYVVQLYKEAVSFLEKETYELCKMRLEEIRRITTGNLELFGIKPNEFKSFLLMMYQDMEKYENSSYQMTMDEFINFRRVYASIADEYYEDSFSAENIKTILDSYLFKAFLDFAAE